MRWAWMVVLATVFGCAPESDTTTVRDAPLEADEADGGDELADAVDVPDAEPEEADGVDVAVEDDAGPDGPDVPDEVGEDAIGPDAELEAADVVEETTGADAADERPDEDVVEEVAGEDAGEEISDGDGGDACLTDCLGVPCSSDGECLEDGLACNEDWGICVVSSCTGRLDFTPCDGSVPARRAFDICVSGACVTPGCGDSTCNSPGPAWTLADTGQRTCFDDVAALGTCPVTASCDTTAWCGQDAQAGWDAAHTAAERFTVAAGTYPVVTDNVTGLVWMGCADGQVGAGCGGPAANRDWSASLLICEASTWGGYSDWRLPDRWELQSLKYLHPAGGTLIYTAAFPMTPAASFWSSSSAAGDSLSAWYVPFGDASIERMPKTVTMHVRCVRGVPAPLPPRFERTGSGEQVVADRATGLVWQACSAGRTGDGCTGTLRNVTWSTALDLCQDSVWGGYTDWRLPNVFELSSIVDGGRTDPATDPTVFPGAPFGAFWSSTTFAGSAGQAWVVDMTSGAVTSTPKGVAADLVRCVRDAP